MRGSTLAGLLVLGALVAGCLPTARAGSLRPTLTMQEASGRSIAVQNGMAVPTFDYQPRSRLELSGRWRVEPALLDNDLSLTDRRSALERIEVEADGRHLPEFDDRDWASAAVPGTLNPAPDGIETGGWYRRTFSVPGSWIGQAATLKLDSANYVADVWVNGTWIGYHEGGYTPFAFDVSAALRPGGLNQITIRVDNPAWGTRTDIVPWGLGDWWNYGGLTGPVWIEATPDLHLVRADVVPHLDAADVSVVVRMADSTLAGAGGPDRRDRAAAAPGDELTVRATILPAEVTEENLVNPDPRALLPAVPRVLDEREATLATPAAGEHAVADIAFSFAQADLWSPGAPALYVMRVSVRPSDEPGPPLDAREARRDDELWVTFGLRHVGVDERTGRLLLNGEPTFLEGVGLHDEELEFGPDGALLHGEPANDVAALRRRLAAASDVHAALLRPGHTPADPALLVLADRLGFAVWEEIPLYHFTPLTFEIAMARGVPQQMLREMALRDMNRPSVIFHGLANESTGDDERTDALRELHEVDREIDGTRLTGQAAYGWQPDDPTHEPLDVAGFTLYYGVFYGEEIAIDSARALRTAHETHPTKPVVVLEFGRWADSDADEARQLTIFEETHRVLERYRADRPAGFVAVANWWTLADFATQIPGIGVEDFGLYRPDGSLRPAGAAAIERFRADPVETIEEVGESELRPALALTNPFLDDWSLARYLGYAFLVATGMIGAATLLLVRRGGRATGRRARRPGGIRR